MSTSSPQGLTNKALIEKLELVEKENERLRAIMRESLYVIECVNRFANGTNDVRALEEIIRHATKLLGIGDAGLISLYNEEDGHDEVVATYNHDWHVLSKIHLRPGQGATGWVYNSGIPRIYHGVDGVVSCLDDLESSTRSLILSSDGKLSSSLICSPLIAHDKVIGAIQIENYSDERQFGEEESNILQSMVAYPLAIALENTGLNTLMLHANRQVRELLNQTVRALEEERARIARDLHDKIAQTLAGLHIALLNFQTFASKSSEGAQMLDYIRELDDELRQTIITTQNLTVDLRPMALNDHDLMEALKRYMKLRVEKAGIQATIRYKGMNRVNLEDWLSTTLYFIAQEALSNVVRHSGASAVELRLQNEGSSVMLIVKDDGCGFEIDRDAECSLNLGLQGMEERLAVLGGNLWISSKLGEGTEIRACIPY